MNGDADGEYGNSGTGEPNVSEESGYIPSFHIGPRIAHYYGDYVRQLFIIASGVILLLAPFLVTTHPISLPFEIGAAVALIFLAALTNPKKMWVMMANVAAAGIGILIYEIFALSAYSSGEMLVFFEREALVVTFLFALYFSVKTLRAMMLGQIGGKTGGARLNNFS